jgi:hypothetical protein
VSGLPLPLLRGRRSKGEQQISEARMALRLHRLLSVDTIGQTFELRALLTESGAERVELVRAYTLMVPLQIVTNTLVHL